MRRAADVNDNYRCPNQMLNQAANVWATPKATVLAVVYRRPFCASGTHKGAIADRFLSSDLEDFPTKAFGTTNATSPPLRGKRPEGRPLD